MNTIIQQPYKGRWDLSRDGVSIGMVYGDYRIGFTAHDQLGITLGHYFTPEEALGAVDYAADARDLDASVRDLEAAWLLTADPS